MTHQDADLTSLKCEACHSGVPKLEDAEVSELLVQVPNWEKVDVNGVPRLRRTFKFDGWLPAVEFVNMVAAAAEETDHHPLILLEWGKVRVDWWTHAIKGLHKNDFIMAAKTDAVLID